MIEGWLNIISVSGFSPPCQMSMETAFVISYNFSEEKARSDIAAKVLNLATFLCTQASSFVVFSLSPHTIPRNDPRFLCFSAPHGNSVTNFTENIYQITVQD